MPTETQHAITMDALAQLGKNRPGRAWLRENAGAWAERSLALKREADNLDAMARAANEILGAHKLKSPEEENSNGDSE